MKQVTTVIPHPFAKFVLLVIILIGMVWIFRSIESPTLKTILGIIGFVLLLVPFIRRKQTSKESFPATKNK